MQKAISTPNQGPRSKIMSEKNRGQKSRVSVPLRRYYKFFLVILVLEPETKFSYPEPVQERAGSTTLAGEGAPPTASLQ